MLMRNWLQALGAFVCVLALTACGDECVDQFDCRDEKGPAPAGKEYQCIENTCELRDKPPTEITCSPECAGTEFCDTSSGEGVCRTCSATQGCSAPLFCDVAANSGKGLCRACSDTGNATDQGCSATAPVCDPAAGNGAGVCRACVDSAQGGSTDSGCSASTPMCDPAAGNGAGVCKACVNSAEGNGTDLGCSASSPVCDAAAASGVGACKACVDSAQGTDTDLGCADTAPICNASASGGKGVCRACLDTAQGTDMDQGCAATAPICDSAASGGAGACKACVDSETGDENDLGCGGTTPLCDSAASGGAGLCRACVNSAQGTGTDLGCAGTAPICDIAASSGAGACRVCVDTENPGSSTADLGCSSPTSLCDTAANNSAGACKVCLTSNEGCAGNQTCNAAGSACEGCLNDAECTNASTPICKPPPPVAICVECIDDAQCASARPTCDTATNICGCTADTQCEDAPGNTDYCDTTVSNGRGQCTVCLTDAHCAAPTPFCDDRMACIQCRNNSHCSLTQACNPTTKACEAVPGADPATTSSQIQAFINKPIGTIDPPITIENAFVTYIKPALGADVAGFFLQAEPDGPAMFVAVDATTLQVQVGDRVTLTVGEVLRLGGELEAASALSGFTPVGRGYPVQNLNTATPPGLAVDRSGANDLQTQLLTQYESELISLTGTIVSAPAASGGGHVAFNITTAGMTTSANTFRLRVPDTLPDAIDLVQTCGFTLKAGPMWRFTTGAVPNQTHNAQPSAYSASDLILTNCPAPRLVTAVTSSLTQVLLTFDRRIDPATVLGTGEQFTFTNGLTATSAQVSGRQVTLSTSDQTPGADYTVTAAASVEDLSGTAVSATANTASFRGYRTPAVLRINEVQPSAASNMDLVELVVVSAGTVDGFVLQQDINSAVTLATFPNASVAAGDFIVVHIAPPAGYTSETTAKDQFPASGTSINYDTAWDFGGGTTGITYSSRLILVKSAAGAIQDGVSFGRTDGTPPGAFPGNLQALQAQGHWLPADCNGVPCTLISVPSAVEVSANWTGLPSSAATPASNTVRRLTATDTNTKDDWGTGAPTWGLPNP
ncbi:Ig-like domain-containing protein [Hyalangium sp.]|uniref:Ig-like domain-containing protein n=1 Tax=Hyalangium sp. TaxID=2028555 RepID=UPI002D62D49F|nr:Ig-like domain-containing protein [Hyalangium sp.]HYI00602.1 Ig-like domain-containing protein [Hyalangium sp.]